MQQPIRVYSRVNAKLYADAIPGHFATNHSHINYYLDMSALKHSRSLAAEAAHSIAYHFASTNVDTILCLEGTEYIGAYLARELSLDSMRGMNSGHDLFLIEPDCSVTGQFIFADNLRPMIENKQVLVLVTSASTGQTLTQARECVEYYGGAVVGYSALFSNISELARRPVVSLFSGADFPHYRNCPQGQACPDCAAGVPLDAIATPHGYTKL